MLSSKTVAICGEEYTGHVNMLWDNTHFLYVKTGGK